MKVNSSFFRFVAILAVALLPAVSFACRCVDPGPTAPAYKKAAAVVVGKVVSLRKNVDSTVTASLQVTQGWKRDVSAELDVSTVATNCAFPFAEGKAYVLYVRDLPANGGYSTALCMGNVAADGADQALAWLKRNGAAKQVIAKP
jgi:hypothetical protein